MLGTLTIMNMKEEEDCVLLTFTIMNMKEEDCVSDKDLASSPEMAKQEFLACSHTCG